MASWLDGWVWPLPIYVGIKPEVSSGFGPREGGMYDVHYGVDVMYRRAHPGDKQLPEYTRGWFCPSGIIPVLAVGPGKVSRIKQTDRLSIAIDHGQVPDFGPLATMTTHLLSVSVKEGQHVEAGEEIAIAGHSGSNTNHAHHEWWFTGLAPKSRDPKDWARDPEPYLRHCGYVEWTGAGQAGGQLVAGGGGVVPGYPGRGAVSLASVALPALLAVGVALA